MTFSDLQCALGWFAGECNAVGVRVSNSRSEDVVLCQKVVKVKELRNLLVLLISKVYNGTRLDLDGWIISFPLFRNYIFLTGKTYFMGRQ